MYRALIIEDNPTEAADLCACIERYGQLDATDFDIKVLRSAVDYIAEGGAWDVVFMDIDLPGINGMEAAQLLRDYDPVVPLIFVTNLAQYAVRGYEVSALGFIVKPVSYNSFRLAMDKAMRALRERVSCARIRTEDGVRLVPASDVMWLSVRDHDLTWGIAGEGAPAVERGTFADALRQLGNAPLVTVSKSAAVNPRHIQTFTRDDVTMVDGTRFSFSRPRKKEALRRIAEALEGIA